MVDQLSQEIYGDFMNAAQAFAGVNEMSQRNTEYQQGQQDRAESKARRQQLNTALSGMASPAGKIPDGTPADIGILARQTYAQGVQADKSIADTQRSQRATEKLDSILAWRQQNPDQPWDKLPLDAYAGADGMAAYATAIDSEAKTEQGRTDIMKNRMARADVALKQFQAAKQSIKNSMSVGDTQNAVNAIEKLTDELPMPYRVKGFNPQDQTLNVEYLDSHTGAFRNSDEIPLKDVLQQTYAVGEKEFVTGIANHMEAVRKGNVEYRQNPMRGVGNNGRRYLIIPQKKPQDPSAVDIEVRDEQTNEKIMFDSWEALNNAGIYKEDLSREKGMADIAKGKALAGEAAAKKKTAQTKQWILMDESGKPKLDQNGNPQIVEGTAAQIKPYLDQGHKFELYSNIKSGNEYTTASANAGKATTARYAKDLEFLLTPFANPGEDLSAMFNDGGGMAAPAKNALEAAIIFYEKHAGMEAGLSPLDRMKFEKAKKAIQLYNGYNGMSQAVSGQHGTPQTAMAGANPQGDGTPPPAPGANSGNTSPGTPPVAGARKAPDGNWYIKDPARPGKYLKVN